MATSRVLIPLAEGCEELEAVTLIDILRRADIDVCTASLSDDLEVCCSRQTRLLADTRLADVKEQDFAMIVLPGGLPGADYLGQDERISDILQRYKADKADKWIGAICAAPQVLVKAGVVDGMTVTAYPGVLEDCTTLQVSDQAVEVDGKVITSRGPGTALDFALTIVEQLQGAAKRQEVESALVR